MASIRDHAFVRWIRSIFRTRRSTQALPTELAYTIHWMDVARSWSPARRARVIEEIRMISASESFEVTTFERRYSLHSTGDTQHSGESLMSLLKVLYSLDKDRGSEEDN
jgi:hypothetical protein